MRIRAISSAFAGRRFALIALFLVAGCGAQADATGSAGAAASAVAPTAAATAEGDGDDGGEGNGASGDVCEAVPADEVEEATGQSVTATDAGETECSYTVNDTGLVNLRYESSFDPNLETARIICEEAEDVSGIGDEAVWCPSLNVLFFNDGDSSLAVQLVFIVDEPTRPLVDIATDLGRLLAERL